MMINILSFISLFSALMVIITNNPVISLLYLISLFINISIILIHFNIILIGFSYIIVYIGAIAILFIFIIMLMNLQYKYINNYSNLPLLLTILISLFWDIYYNLNTHQESSIQTSYHDNSNIIYSNLDSHYIGSIMYTDYSLLFILISIVLLLTMIGTINIITITKGSRSGLWSN